MKIFLELIVGFILKFTLLLVDFYIGYGIIILFNFLGIIDTNINSNIIVGLNLKEIFGLLYLLMSNKSVEDIEKAIKEK